MFVKNEIIKKEKYIENSVKPTSMEGMEKILYQMKNCICKIYKEDNIKASGFFCKIPFPDENNLITVLITNNHVLGKTDIEKDKVIKLSINNEKEGKNIIIDKKRKVFTNPKLDVTIIEIKPYKDKLNSNNFLEIDENINTDTNLAETTYKDKSIYTLHYPKNEKIMCSFGKLTRLLESSIYHSCSTNDGSSGSPIISLDTFKVIGVHFGGSNLNFNKATFIKYAIDALKNKYKNLIMDNNMYQNELIEKEKYNEMTIEYSVGDYDYVRIFSKKFVENNKDKCIITLNGNEIEMCESLNKNEFKLNQKFQIKLKEIKPIVDMSYMFFECRRLKSIPNISKWNSINIIDMGYMFDSCTGLIKLPDISTWNTSNVINFRAIFEGCTFLESLPDISKWNTNKVTDMSYMFNQCLSLKELPDISKWNLENVTNLEAVFCKCSSLKSLPDISKWNTKQVKSFKGMFFDCSSLLQIPDISNWNADSLIDVSFLFNICISLKNLPDISKWNFDNVINMKGLFKTCKSLLSLPDISKWNTKNVTNMGGLFFECHSIKSLPDISKWDTSNVTSMDLMFADCHSLLSLPDISSWNTENVTNMYLMFCQCSSLISLPDLSKWNIDNVINIDYIFANCNESLQIPKKFL